jgi:hypothetical protein
VPHVKENGDAAKSAGTILKYNHINNLGKAMIMMKLIIKLVT